MEKVIEEALCLPSRGIRRNPKNKAIKINKENMTTLAQFWIAIVLENVAPNSHKSGIPLSRAQLIFAIIKGLSIDIGQTISQEIFHIISKKMPRYGFPVLITTLIIKRGVDLKKDFAQPFVALKPTFDACYIENFFFWQEDDTVIHHPTFHLNLEASRIGLSIFMRR